MSSPKQRGPRPLAEVLGELFARRGLSRLQALEELQRAWDAAVGEPGRTHTRLGDVRRGVLNVTVAHPALLEELRAFQKPALLAALRRDAPGTIIHDIRFRVGPMADDDPSQAPNPRPHPTPRRGPDPGRGPGAFGGSD